MFYVTVSSSVQKVFIPSIELVLVCPLNLVLFYIVLKLFFFDCALNSALKLQMHF